MFREDYIMRLIRQLSQVLTRIIFQIDSKQYQDALKEIQHTGKLFFGPDLSAIHTITYDELQEALVERLDTSDTLDTQSGNSPITLL